MRPLPALLLAALCAAPTAALAEEPAQQPRIYRWVDANGVAHYTTDEERIPPSLRRRFGLPTAPLERKPVDARAPGAAEPAPAPAPADPSAGLDGWISQERAAAPPDVAAPPAPPAEPAAGPDARPDAGAGAPPAVTVNAAGAADRLAEIELRIAELSAAIAADEDALSAWIGDPAGGDPVEVGSRPEFREIAARLPKRIQELEALRRERDALEPATP
jgi:hypothetical protein